MITYGDIEATGPVGSQNLYLAGLHPDTADCFIALDGRLHNGPYTKELCWMGFKPAWSAGRMLTLLPYNEAFYWSLYRLEDADEFRIVCVVLGGKVKPSFNDKRLVNVAGSALQTALTYDLLDDSLMGVAGDGWASVYGAKPGPLSPPAEEIRAVLGRSKISPEMFRGLPLDECDRELLLSVSPAAIDELRKKIRTIKDE